MYFVYILTNKNNTVLYIGITNDLARRLWQHKTCSTDSFTQRYRATKLVYYEVVEDVRSAIQREKRLKKWNRSWKKELIGKTNPNWEEIKIM
ncbi:GIY-YIG nuclease family protein [Candidatus Uhrbacteria bacterium]|nr:GIY-YIG nuclease family protein [Candidatus Uhrbacteria bacterium]